MDQRRVWLAVLLSLLLLLLYEQFVVRRYRPSTPMEPPAHDVATAPVPPVEAPPPSTAPAPAAAPTPGGELAVAPGDAPTTVVETDLFRIHVTARGARLARLELKDFREKVALDSRFLNLVEQGSVLPLTADLGGRGNDAGILYTASRDRLEVAGDQEGDVVFTAEVDGRALEKRYRFRGNSYLFDVDVTSKANAGAGLGLVITPIAKEAAAGGNQPGHEIALALAQQKMVEKSLEDVAKEPIRLETSSWGGFSAQYFLAVAMPADGTATTVMGAATRGTGEPPTPIVRIDAPARDGTGRFKVYVGPKERNTLTEAGHSLDRALDFGWFWFIALPLLWALKALHKISGNYGIDIILLTASVKLVTIPLTQTTFRSMKAMQKLQPDVQRLRERHKDDPVALQKEMMELYKRHRVNPLSGCLPMVLQIPIFVGLYNALMHAIELRHAPFFLWINDLAAPDRLMVGGVGIPVLTLLMGGSMLLQQWMTPQQGDPTQQRMMMIMPVVFTFMFINFPAGLVLYWLVNNVLSIAQQYVMLHAADEGARK